MSHPLDGARLKLSQAEQHLDALAGEIREFVESKPYSVRSQHHALDDSYSAILDDIPQVRPEWGVMLGDFLHNTRSALDHIVAQLVILAGAGAKMHTRHQFPILHSPNDWHKRVVQPQQRGRPGLLDFIDPVPVAIVEGLQPYQPTTRFPSLTILRDFSNTDKHRLIHGAVANFVAAPQLSASWNINVEVRDISYPSPGTPLQPGTEIAHYKVVFPLVQNRFTQAIEAPNSEMNVRIHLALTTVFGEPGKEDTRIKDFRRCLTDAGTIVGLFAPLF